MFQRLLQNIWIKKGKGDCMPVSQEIKEKDNEKLNQRKQEEQKRVEQGDIVSRATMDFGNLLAMKPPRKEAERKSAYVQAFTNGFSQGVSPMMRAGMMGRQLPDLQGGANGPDMDGPDF